MTSKKKANTQLFTNIDDNQAVIVSGGINLEFVPAGILGIRILENARKLGIDPRTLF